MTPILTATLGLLGVTGVLYAMRKTTPDAQPQITPVPPPAAQIVPLPGLMADVDDVVLVDLKLLPPGLVTDVLTSPEARLASLSGASVAEVRVTGVDASTGGLRGILTGVKVPVAQTVTPITTTQLSVGPFPRTAVVEVSRNGVVLAKSPAAV